jgi:hypothetical protein
MNQTYQESPEAEKFSIHDFRGNLIGLWNIKYCKMLFNFNLKKRKLCEWVTWIFCVNNSWDERLQNTCRLKANSAFHFNFSQQSKEGNLKLSNSTPPKIKRKAPHWKKYTCFYYQILKQIRYSSYESHRNVCISLTEKKQNDNIFHLLIFFHLFLISFLFQQDLLRKMIFCIF